MRWRPATGATSRRIADRSRSPETTAGGRSPTAPKAARRPRTSTDSSAQRGIGASAEIPRRAEIGPLGAFLRPQRGGTDLVIVPTMRREENAARGPESARGKGGWWAGFRVRADSPPRPWSSPTTTRRRSARAPQARSGRGRHDRRTLAFGGRSDRGRVAAIADRGGRADRGRVAAIADRGGRVDRGRVAAIADRGGRADRGRVVAIEDRDGRAVGVGIGIGIRSGVHCVT